MPPFRKDKPEDQDNLNPASGVTPSGTGTAEDELPFSGVDDMSAIPAGLQPLNNALREDGSFGGGQGDGLHGVGSGGLNNIREDGSEAGSFGGGQGDGLHGVGSGRTAPQYQPRIRGGFGDARPREGEEGLYVPPTKWRAPHEIDERRSERLITEQQAREQQLATWERQQQGERGRGQAVMDQAGAELESQAKIRAANERAKAGLLPLPQEQEQAPAAPAAPRKPTDDRGIYDPQGRLMPHRFNPGLHRETGKRLRREDFESDYLYNFAMGKPDPELEGPPEPRWDAPTSDPFDPEGSGYDYETARKAGLGPDETGHWPSRDPKTGQILKGQAHPSYGLTLAGEEEEGFSISKGEDGRYSSQRLTQDQKFIEESREGIAANKGAREEAGRQYQDKVQQRISGRREGVEKRQALRQWQSDARRAMRNGETPPPMPGAEPVRGGGSWGAPGVGPDGGWQITVTDENGNDISVDLTEDPNNPGEFFPAPSDRTPEQISQLAAQDPKFIEGVSRIAKIAMESGVRSSLLERFNKTDKALKSIRREDFQTDSQYESARGQILSEYGGLAKQVIARQGQFLSGRKGEQATDKREHELFSRDVRSRMEHLRAADIRDKYRAGPRSDEELLQQAIGDVSRDRAMDKAIQGALGGTLDEAGAARASVVMFPDEDRHQGTGFSQEIPGVLSQFNDNDFGSIDSTLRNDFDNAPFTIARGENGGMTLVNKATGASFEGVLVPGHDHPAAVARSDRDANILESIGMPYIKLGEPTKMLNAQDMKATVRPERKEWNEVDAGEKVVTDLTAEVDASLTAGLDFNKATEKYDAEVAKIRKNAAAQGFLTHAQVGPGAAARTAATAASIAASGARSLMKDVVQESMPDKPDRPEGMQVYTKLLAERNFQIEEDFEANWGKPLTAKGRATTKVSGLPQKAGPEEAAFEKAHAAALKRRNAPLSKEEARRLYLSDERISEAMLNNRRDHDRNQELQERARGFNRPGGGNYADLYDTKFGEGPDGLRTFALRGTNRAFTPTPLPTIEYGEGFAPVAGSPDDLASVAFDSPFIIDSRTPQWSISKQRNIMVGDDPREIQLSGAMFRQLGNEVMKNKGKSGYAPALVNVARAIQRAMPGKAVEEYKFAAERMLIRLGSVHPTDLPGGDYDY